MFRRAAALLAVAALALCLVGCEIDDGKTQFDTSLPSQNIGFRITDGELRIWTGAPCEGTTRVSVRFSGKSSAQTELLLYTPTYDGVTPGVELTYLDLTGPYPGFEVKTPIPVQFDWRAAEFINIDLKGPPVARGIGGVPWGPIAAEISAHSSEHLGDVFYFPELGWLGPTQIAAGDGKDFMTVCTPDPAKRESERVLVGVRVTDDALRLWTAAPCMSAVGAIVTFQPGQADLILTNAPGRPEVEYLALEPPSPQFTVAQPLPGRFDWRMAESVLLRLVDDDYLVWSEATDLAIPLAESAKHPPDVYYFQGVGWLGPADVAAREGDSLHTICGR